MKSECYQQFQKWAGELSTLHNVTTLHANNENKQLYTFSSNVKDSLTVTLEYINGVNDFVDLMQININGADTGYWNSSEFSNLSKFYEAARAALQSNYAYRKSTILRRKEICFKVNDGWLCTHVNDNHFYHSLTFKRHIKTLD